MDAFPTPSTLLQQIQVTTNISKLTIQHRYPTFPITKLTTHSSKPATVSKNLSTMSLPQKRSGEVDRTNKSYKRQNRDSATSGSEDSSAMEELPSQGHDLSLSPTLNQSRRIYRNIFTSYGGMETEALSSRYMLSPSGLWTPPAEPLLDRLDRLERGQDRLRTELDALHPMVASSVVNKTVTSELETRVRALEAKSSSSSKEALLDENEQLHRNIALLEHNLTNQATTLRNVQQSNTELYNQLCQANAKIAFLEGGGLSDTTH